MAILSFSSAAENAFTDDDLSFFDALGASVEDPVLALAGPPADRN